jgi:hypothetical protein
LFSFKARGSFEITLKGESGSSDNIVLINDNTLDSTLNAGSSVKLLRRAVKNPGSTITSAIVIYKKTNAFLLSLLYQDSWSFKNIEVFSGENQKSIRLCPAQTYLKSGIPMAFNLC